MFFQLQDIKRRRPAYYSYKNVNSWADVPDNHLTWNIQRGLFIGGVSWLIQGWFTNLIQNANLLLTKYEPPTSIKQSMIFYNQIKKLASYKQGFRLHGEYALAFTLLTVIPRITLYRMIDGGWQSPFGSFDFNFIRKIPGVALMSILTAPLATFVEMTKRAVIADKTFPQQLRAGYKGIMHALYQCPRQNGFYYLFKNTSPFMIGQFLLTFTLFYTHDFMRDKLSVFSRKTDMSPNSVTVISAIIATYLACVFSYPFYCKSVQMVDFDPKTKKVSTYGNNYRKAMVWLWQGPWQSWNNAFPGFFKKYFFKKGPACFMTLYFADKLGLFTHWRVDFLGGAGDNSKEDCDI